MTGLFAEMLVREIDFVAQGEEYDVELVEG